MENKITATLTSEVTTQSKPPLWRFKKSPALLIELSPVESKRLMRMEAGRIDFVRKALLLGNSNENLRPQFFELGEMGKDIDLCQSMDEIIALLERWLKLMYDTRNQAGHEAYSAALEVYNTAKRGTAKGIQGADIAYEDLKQMFNGQGKTKMPDSEQS